MQRRRDVSTGTCPCDTAARQPAGRFPASTVGGLAGGCLGGVVGDDYELAGDASAARPIASVGGSLK